MTQNDDMGKIENAICMLLKKDSALNVLLNGRIYQGLEKEDLQSKLVENSMAVLAVNYSDNITSPFPGSGSSHLCEVSGTVQIDCASRLEKNLIRNVLQNVVRLLYNNIDITVGAIIYHLVVPDGLPQKIFYSQELGAFQGTVRLSLYYEALIE